MKGLHFKVNHAQTSERRLEKSRLLSIDTKKNSVDHLFVEDLPLQFRKGDVIVVNDAGTFPASFSGFHQETKSPIEIRLLMPCEIDQISSWRVALFGEGDWRTPTEKRAPPPEVFAGDTFQFEEGLVATIKTVHKETSTRLLTIEFQAEGPTLWAKFYGAGRPVQYSYLKENLDLSDQQTIFSGKPVALEPSSASFALSWNIMNKIQLQGAKILRITHGTGISNTGHIPIDERLPFAEPYFIAENIQEELIEALREGRRIIAVGTGVVRALETWGGKKSTAQWRYTSLKINAQYVRKVVTGLLTGFHEPEASHLHLLMAFSKPQLLQKAYREAGELGYLWHEYGDVCLFS